MAANRILNRRLPAWRDPEFPDLTDETATVGGTFRGMDAYNQLQRERGLPPIDIGWLMRGKKDIRGNPTPPSTPPVSLTLSFWDKKQKKTRSVTIAGDEVIGRYLWNKLHPLFRRQVPSVLLPPAILSSLAAGPAPAGPAGGRSQ